jgi:adenylosuccinate synthase
MPVTSIVGAQWGDEGKGKIVDVLAGDADIVSRFGGGSNAGHTVVNQFGTFKLHSLPSGVFNPATINIVGTGTVVDFDSMCAELDQLAGSGVSPIELAISSRAHIIMPYHVALDRLKDAALGPKKIGTTGRGIGPAYADKADRVGIQVGELLDWSRFRERVAVALEQKNRIINALYDHPGFDTTTVLERAAAWRDRFAPNIKDTMPIIRSALHEDARVLLEGQLGVMRDLDWGVYPYVTSSTTFAAGAGSGAGIPPAKITDILAVVKAYTSAVGEGPLPTELTGPDGECLRDRGQEYGATTGRPRRVGWLDGVALRYAANVGGFSRIAVTKLDVLDGIDPLRIAVAYQTDDGVVADFPIGTALESAEPVYEDMEGWIEDTSSITRWEDLPSAAQRYLRRISELAAAPISMVSVGASRESTIEVVVGS